jgi:glutamate synthase (NADPH/NADH) small chain
MHLSLHDASGRQSGTDQGSHLLPRPRHQALGFDPEDLPAAYGEPELGITRWGTLRWVRRRS